MSSDLSQIRHFRTIIDEKNVRDFEVSQNAKEKRKEQDKISSVASLVIAHLQSTFNPKDRTQIPLFIQHMKVLDKKFEEAGSGTVFATSIHAISLLYQLRSNLDLSKQHLVQDPFIVELKGLVEASEIKNPEEVAQKLYQFQSEVLLPLLRSVHNSQELRDLGPLVDDCNDLKNKLESIGIEEKMKIRLQEQCSIMIGAFNVQGCKTHALYARLVSYDKQSFGSLNDQENRDQVIRKLDRFMTAFVDVAQDPMVSLQDKIAIYHAVQKLQGHYAAHGDEAKLDPILKKLRAAFNIPEGIDSSFPMELAELVATRGTIHGKKDVEGKLYTFEEKILLPAIQKASTKEELIALQVLIDQCVILEDRLVSLGKKEVLEHSSTLRDLWKMKMVKTDDLFTWLVKYQKGECGDLKDETRRNRIAGNLKVFVDALIHVIDRPEMTREEVEAVYKGLCILYEDFSLHKGLIEPVLRKLCEAATLSFPESEPPVKSLKAPSSSKLSHLISQFEQKGSSEVLPPPKTRAARTSTVQSPESIRDRMIADILNKIKGLHPSNTRFDQDIQQIREAINQLKRLALTPEIDYSSLEEALDMIQDPRKLKMSEEEELFVEQLLLKYGAPKTAFLKYQEVSKKPMEEPHNALLRALKESATSLESLLMRASIAKEAAKDEAISARFKSLSDIGQLHPLTDQFPTLFPTLIRNLEVFTREVVLLKLEKKWQEILAPYDGGSSGKFSKILEYYSHINPKTIFPDFIRLCQIHFFNQLNLEAINHTSKEGLVTYMESIVEVVKNYPEEEFVPFYNRELLSKHIWLLRNLDNIKVPFNQGDDDNQNLGEGVCFANALARFKILQQTPQKPSEEIAMGSSTQTRFSQLSYMKNAKQHLLSYGEVEEQMFQKIGLKRYHTHTLTKPPSMDRHRYVVSEMERFALAGHTNFLVVLRNPGIGGHVVNVQVDSATGMYRLFDDNIGLLQYATLDEFKEQVAQYLKLYYPRFKEYKFYLMQVS